MNGTNENHRYVMSRQVKNRTRKEEGSILDYLTSRGCQSFRRFLTFLYITH